jgi:DHA1 family bicyclomycin/chloramphenicol resistance-like MFS transporter
MEMYLPAMQLLAEELNTSVVQVNYTITFFLIGAAIGETIGGSISDQIGRKRTVLIGLTLYVIATLGIASAHDITVIQVLRFFQSLGCGFAVVVGLPTLRDLFDPETAAKKIPIVTAAAMVAPMIAPVIGTVLMQWDWRYIFYFLAVYGVATAITYVVFVPARGGTGRRFSLSELGRQYKSVITFRAHEKPVAFYYVLLQGFLAGTFLTFLTNASWIYLGYFGVAVTALPLFFLIHTGATFIANVSMSKLMHYVDARVLLKVGSIIHITALSGILILQLNGKLSLVAFTVLFFPMMIGANFLMTSHRAIMLTYFEKLTGSATSLLSLSRYSFGAIGGALSGVFFDGTLLPIILIMFACSFCAFSLISFLLPKNTLKEIALLQRSPEH